MGAPIQPPEVYATRARRYAEMETIMVPPEDRSKYWSRRWYYARRAAGECVSCGVNADRRGAYCARCAWWTALIVWLRREVKKAKASDMRARFRWFKDCSALCSCGRCWMRRVNETGG